MGGEGTLERMCSKGLEPPMNTSMHVIRYLVKNDNRKENLTNLWRDQFKKDIKIKKTSKIILLFLVFYIRALFINSISKKVII